MRGLCTRTVYACVGASHVVSTCEYVGIVWGDYDKAMIVERRQYTAISAIDRFISRASTCEK